MVCVNKEPAPTVIGGIRAFFFGKVVKFDKRRDYPQKNAIDIIKASLKPWIPQLVKARWIGLEWIKPTPPFVD